MDEHPEIVEGTVEPEQPSTQVIPFAPAAGEIIDLSDRPRVAATIRELNDWQVEVLRPVLDRLQGALIEEADRQGQFTLRFGRMEARVDGPDVQETTWHPDLAPMLAELVEAGLPPERAEMLARSETVWTVDGRECNRIAKNPTYAAIIDRYRDRVPRKRRVTVKRTG